MRKELYFWSFLMPLHLILFDTKLVSSQCQDDQQSILIQFKDSLQFDSSLSTKLVSWNPNVADCCVWPGVSCSTTGQVIGLDLTNEAIYDGINDSSVLFDLKNLEMLNLAANKFNSTPIPSRFGSFASLSYLNLSGSRFSGQIPEELSQLDKLEILDLSLFLVHPLLRLEKPNLATLVQNFTMLRGLYLDTVNISSQASDWGRSLSVSLPNLEVLSLSNCQLSGPLDDSLAKLHSLSAIRLARNNLSAPVPDFFANFKNLIEIDLVSCNLVGTFPNKVLQLQKLEILKLSLNENLYGSLPDFPPNGSLKTLLLSGTNFSGGIPESIGDLKNLSRIDFSNSNFNGQVPKSIQNLTKLVHINLLSNNFSGQIPSFHMCKNLTQLRYIYLSSNSFIGQIPSFQMCKNLTSVDFSRNSLSGTIPSAHFQDLENLITVDLMFNDFSGSIPSSLFSLQNLQKIELSNNNFSGLLPNFTNPSLSSLNTLDLRSNKLEGEIPRSIFELSKLSILLLSSNNLSGTIRIVDFQDRLVNLTTLDLSFNSLSIETSESLTLVNHLPKFTTLKLASCNLSKFPNLRNQSRLTDLDLSNNKIEGKIPSWLWKVGNGSLWSMNLSYNRLTGLEEPYSFGKLRVLDLHSNYLTGVVPVPLEEAEYIDYSNNSFNSSLPESIGGNLLYMYFFSVSSNMFTGMIPKSICNVSYLKVLDMSNNQLSGSIPKCLIEIFGLVVLNLANNSLTGQIDGGLSSYCGLNTLDLHENLLEGKIPEYLVNCTALEVLNLGRNKINDTFPCFLSKNTNLRVLVLRSNMLHGVVICGQTQHENWLKLQILDVASNSLSDEIPINFFSEWGAMMNDDNGDPPEKKYLGLTLSPLRDYYYQYTVIVTVKGLELELVKILTVFTSIDFSDNHFSGEIPSGTGQLKALYFLNLSHNEFSGSIPPSIQNLSNLESLDISSNRITGHIPSELTSLPFLSSFNLSYNQLEGIIPTGKQFNTFDASSYIGNKRLCGFPLNRTCTIPVQKNAPDSQESGDEKDWQTFFYGMAVGAGSLVVISVLYILWKGIFFWYN